MRLAIDIGTLEDYVWIDLHIFRHVFGFCWTRDRWRSWRHRAWFYHRPYPPKSPPTQGQK